METRWKEFFAAHRAAGDNFPLNRTLSCCVTVPTIPGSVEMRCVCKFIKYDAALIRKARIPSRRSIQACHYRNHFCKSNAQLMPPFLSAAILRELGKQAAQLGLHFRSHTYSVGASFVHQSSKSSAIRSVSPADCLAISPVLQRGSIWRFLSRRSSQNYKYTLSDEVARDVQQAKEGKPRFDINALMVG